MLFSGIQLPFSGYLLHHYLNNNEGNIIFIPMSFYVFSSIVFTVAVTFHLKYNWRPMLRYIKEKSDGLLRYRKEMLIAALTILFLVTFALRHVLQHHMKY